MMRLEYGFNGYEVPPTPRAARSARRRCFYKRKADDSRTSAFDLLANVAGNLLLDGDKNSHQSAAAEDPVCNVDDDERKPFGLRNYFADEIDPISQSPSGVSSSDCLGVNDDDCQLRLGIFSSSEEDWDTKKPPDVFSSVVDSVSRCGSLPVTRDDSGLKLVTKDDDDENSGFGDGMFAASSDDIGIRCSKNQKSIRDYPPKKRKLLDYKQVCCEEISSPPRNRASSQVKLKIKSFRVPEMLLEIPETATIGSLKKMVMESVTTVLGGGVRVGVVVQGNTIKDDTKTLLQMGMSRRTSTEGVGFFLEPIPAPPPQLITGKQATPLTTIPALPPMMKTTGLKLNAKRSESAKRRIRRPFTVAEVEALVLAVEKLGTGRWRDVKLRAFDHSRHRTYVDLKDKWKTLVHTARISPQQRRGEPVPEELLNRVLAAHAFWAQHQPKHHLKAQPNIS